MSGDSLSLVHIISNILICLFLVIEINVEIIMIVTNVTSMFLKFMSIGTSSKYIETRRLDRRKSPDTEEGSKSRVKP